MKGDYRLFKLFLWCLAFHLGILPLFSLILPEKKRAPSLIEVSLKRLPAAPQKPILLAETRVSPKLPSTRFSDTSLRIAEKILAGTRGTDSFAAREYHLLSNVPTLEVPEFPVQFPAVSAPAEGKGGTEPGSTEEISGPGGLRRLVYREPLKYPEWAQKRAIEGNIRIKFWVEPNGRVAETELLISSGYPELDVFVEEVFRKWLFEPAEENKKVWGEIVFRLRLR